MTSTDFYILTLAFKDTLSNKSDLAAAALYCAQIFFVLLRAMVGKTEKDISKSMKVAISDLRKYVFLLLTDDSLLLG